MNIQDTSVFQKKLLGAAFIVGPALLCASTSSFALGIGLIPPGVSSWVEGIFGSLGLACFVPVYLELSRRVGRTHPRLGALTSVSGLFGATVGVALEFLRVAEQTFRDNGAGDAVFASAYANPGWAFLSVALLGPLFPLTSILLGIGTFAGRSLPRWMSVCLVGAGVGFPLAQVAGLELALRFAYPAAGVLWLVALAPIGVSYFRELSSERRNAPGATPVQRRNALWKVLASE